MSRAQIFRDTAQQALKNPQVPIETAWTQGLPSTHRLLQNEDVVAIATDGAQRHASEDEILTMARSLLDRDWGTVQYQDDIEQNERNSRRERGTVFGIYTAQDGTILWTMQSHRYLPPTVMLPEER